MSANQLPQERPGALDTSRHQHDYILIDGSGSMLGKWQESMDAIDAYFAGLKGEQLQSDITLHVFDDHDREYIARQTTLSEWVPLRQAPIGAHWGGTPLYDAIFLMGKRLRDLDPPRASIVIVTDGQEGGSEFTDETQARAILDWCRAKGWQVTFIGADFNNSDTARALGASEHSAIGVQKRLLADAASNLAKKRLKYGRYGDDMHFSAEEKQQFGGYLNAPESGK